MLRQIIKKMIIRKKINSKENSCTTYLVASHFFMDNYLYL